MKELGEKCLRRAKLQARNRARADVATRPDETCRDECTFGEGQLLWGDCILMDDGRQRRVASRSMKRKPTKPLFAHRRGHFMNFANVGSHHTTPSEPLLPFAVLIG